MDVRNVNHVVGVSVIRMEVLDLGHSYLVHQYDAHPDSGFIEANITFMKRNEPSEKYPGNINYYPGTNCQEVLRVLIDRVNYLDNQQEDYDNNEIIHSLRKDLYLFERRNWWNKHHTEKGWFEHFGSKGIDTISDQPIELLPTCRTCGHWFCEEHNNDK